jgi:hypothetical protein
MATLKDSGQRVSLSVKNEHNVSKTLLLTMSEHGQLVKLTREMRATPYTPQGTLSCVTLMLRGIALDIRAHYFFVRVGAAKYMGHLPKPDAPAVSDHLQPLIELAATDWSVLL